MKGTIVLVIMLLLTAPAALATIWYDTNMRPIEGPRTVTLIEGAKILANLDSGEEIRGFKGGSTPAGRWRIIGDTGTMFYLPAAQTSRFFYKIWEYVKPYPDTNPPGLFYWYERRYDLYTGMVGAYSDSGGGLTKVYLVYSFNAISYKSQDRLFTGEFRPVWNSSADVNGDKRIDWLDFSIIQSLIKRHFGETKAEGEAFYADLNGNGWIEANDIEPIQEILAAHPNGVALDTPAETIFPNFLFQGRAINPFNWQVSPKDKLTTTWGRMKYAK